MELGRSTLGGLLCAALTLGAGSAAAQERVVQDTLSADTPTGVTCGFCATERFGVVFRELPAPRRGIEPEDFPLRLAAVQVAMAAATVSPGPTCTPSTSGGTITAPIEIYAGSEIPTGAITSLPAEGPWNASEELVFAADAPLALSVDADGMGRYAIDFNELEVRDESGGEIVVDAGTYLRVVVTLPAAEPATACTGGLDLPGGFPVRDADGRIADERGFIYAAGVGWLWNEQASINGDWGIRLALFRAPPRDGGTVELDASTSGDAGAVRDAGGAAMDAATAPDGGAEPSGGGCSCRAGRSRSAGWPLAIALACLALRRRQSASTV